MRKLLFLTGMCLCFLFGTATAQKASRLNIDLTSNTISVDGTTFSNSSTIEEWEKFLGRAQRIERKRGEDHYFIYDSLGIALSLQKGTDKVGELLITYQNDGDLKVAKQVFRGTLMVNNQVVNDKTSLKEMGKLAKTELVEVMNGYFITPKQALNILMYYPEGKYDQLKQYAFSFGTSN